MAGKTLTFIRNSDGDKIWDEASGAYVKYVPPVEKPEQLYAYTKEGIDMYAWTIEDGSRVNPSSCTTIYTKTPVLDKDNGVFYDENGVEYDTWMGFDVEITNSTYFMTNTHVTEATAEKITMSASDPT